MEKSHSRPHRHTMFQTDSTSFSLPHRRRSELPLRSRPAMSNDHTPELDELPRTHQSRVINRTSTHAPADYTTVDWQSFFRNAPPHSPAVFDEPIYPELPHDPNMPSSSSSSSPSAHRRKHSGLSKTVSNSISVFTRRTSVSAKSTKQPQKVRMPETRCGPPVNLTRRKSYMWDSSDTSSIATSTKSRARDFLCAMSSMAPRRRPSMPLLNWLPPSEREHEMDPETELWAEPDVEKEIERDSEPIVPFDFKKWLKVPNASQLGVPDYVNGGDGARASAAAQNEALANARASPLPPYYAAATSTSDLGDSESGIGITLDECAWDDSKSSHAARCDPTALLPTELLENIFSYLDAKSLLQAELVSSQWKSLTRSQIVWREVFYRQYASHHPGRSMAGLSVPGLGKNVRGQDYRKLFRVRTLIDKRWENGEAAAIYLNGHKDSVYCVQFDEDKIVTGSRDNTVRVWNARTYQCTHKLGPPNNARERAQTQRTEVEPQGIVPFFKMEATSPDPIHRASGMCHQASILCLQYDEEILVTGSSDFSCIVWSIKDNYKPIMRLLGHTAGVLDVCLDSKRIITCSKDTTIKIWDRSSGRLLKTLYGHQGPVNAVQVRGNLLASASGDGMSKLWRMEDGLCIKEFRSRERGLACVEFSEDGRTIYAGGNDHVVYEYNTVTGNIERELQGHTDLVRSLHLDTANSRIVSGSYDHSIKVWNTKKGYQGDENGLKISLHGWTSSWMLAAKSNYRKIACASQDGRVVIVDFGYGIDGVDLVEAR